MERRVSKRDRNTTVGAWEALVGMCGDRKAWVRDTGSGGLKCFLEGDQSPTPQADIKSWLPPFHEGTSKERKTMIRAAITEYTDLHSNLDIVEN